MGRGLCPWSASASRTIRRPSSFRRRRQDPLRGLLGRAGVGEPPRHHARAVARGGFRSLRCSCSTTPERISSASTTTRRTQAVPMLGRSFLIQNFHASARHSHSSPAHRPDRIDRRRRRKLHSAGVPPSATTWGGPHLRHTRMPVHEQLLTLTIAAVDRSRNGSSTPGSRSIPVATQETGADRANGTEEARISTNSQKDGT